MNFDVEGVLAAVDRSVALIERDEQPAGGVTLSRSFAATAEDVWDAGTNAERIPRWFLPVTGDLSLGGRYQLEGNAGGTITECERLSHFKITWEFAGDTSWVEARISDDGDGRIRLTLTHTSILSEHWDTYGPGAVGVGWELVFLGLSLHIANPKEPKPDEMAFVTSPDGKAIITGSSEAWGAASAAAGTDPDAATSAAQRTTAFYTGESIVAE